MSTEKFYDLTNLKEMLDGDKAAVKKMIKIFLDTTPNNLSELNNSYKSNDLDIVGKLAHKLKSSIDIFNITELKSEIRKIEKYAKDKINIDELPAHIGKLNSILSNVIKQVEADF